MLKDGICAGIGIIGSTIAALFGGWDAALVTLVIFMAVDYITGLLVAGVFHRSGKSESGALESHAGWKGLLKKGVTLRWCWWPAGWICSWAAPLSGTR